MDLARSVDPNGSRTLGVLTKPDTIGARAPPGVAPARAPPGQTLGDAAACLTAVGGSPCTRKPPRSANPPAPAPLALVRPQRRARTSSGCPWCRAPSSGWRWGTLWSATPARRAPAARTSRASEAGPCPAWPPARSRARRNRHAAARSTQRATPQKDLDRGISDEDADAKEARFFEEDPFWWAPAIRRGARQAAHRRCTPTLHTDVARAHADLASCAQTLPQAWRKRATQMHARRLPARAPQELRQDRGDARPLWRREAAPGAQVGARRRGGRGRPHRQVGAQSCTPRAAARRASRCCRDLLEEAPGDPHPRPAQQPAGQHDHQGAAQHDQGSPGGAGQGAPPLPRPQPRLCVAASCARPAAAGAALACAWPHPRLACRRT